MSVTTLVFDAFGTLFDIAAPARHTSASQGRLPHTPRHEIPDLTHLPRLIA